MKKFLALALAVALALLPCEAFAAVALVAGTGTGGSQFTGTTTGNVSCANACPSQLTTSAISSGDVFTVNVLTGSASSSISTCVLTDGTNSDSTLQSSGIAAAATGHMQSCTIKATHNYANGSSVNVTLTASAGALLTGIDVSGADQTTPMDATATTNTNNGTTSTSLSLSTNATSRASTLIFGCFAVTTSGTITGDNFTSFGANSGLRAHCGYQIESSTGTFTYTATTTPTTTYGGIMTVIQAPAGGATITRMPLTGAGN